MNRRNLKRRTGLLAAKNVLVQRDDRLNMLKRIAALVLSGICISTAVARDEFAAPVKTPRERLLLDGNWRFQPGDPAGAEKEFAYPEPEDLAKTRVEDLAPPKRSANDSDLVNLGATVS